MKNIGIEFYKRPLLLNIRRKATHQLSGQTPLANHLLRQIDLWPRSNTVQRRSASNTLAMRSQTDNCRSGVTGAPEIP